MVFLLDTDTSIVDFSELDSARAGVIRADLAAGSAPLRPYDLLIAAQAVRAAHVLVTGNTRELSRVDGLETENWLVPD